MGPIDQVRQNPRANPCGSLHLPTCLRTPFAHCCAFLKRTTYIGADNKTRDWESAARLTRPKGSLIDGVGIVAVLEKETGPELLLQKQYRPPIDKVCIEVPAGLIDEGEDAVTCAVRELKEETGYVGKVIEGRLGITPVMFNGEFSRETSVRAAHHRCQLSPPTRS